MDVSIHVWSMDGDREVDHRRGARRIDLPTRPLHPHTIFVNTRETPQAFTVELVCEKHGLKPEELAAALKVLEVPRVVERQGQKFGYWN